jgi:hypothetical protein
LAQTAAVADRGGSTMARGSGVPDAAPPAIDEGVQARVLYSTRIVPETVATGEQFRRACQSAKAIEL